MTATSRQKTTRQHSASGSTWLRRVDPGLLVLLVLFILSIPLVTPRIYAVDSVEYFSYLPSLLFDHDLDFTDEYTYLDQQNPNAKIYIGLLAPEKHDPITGLPLNPAPFGTAVFWSPAYLLAHGGVLLARALGSNVPANGLSRPYVLAVCYASVAYALAGLLLSYRLARRYFSAFASALAVILAWLATPVFFYSHANPPWSHSVSLFAVALFVTAWVDTREKRTAGQFFLVGLLGGLVVLVREQDALFLIIPAVEGLLAYLAFLRTRAKEWGALPVLVGKHALMVLGAVLGFLPQLPVYKVLNGRFGPNPTVTGKMTWWSPHFFQALVDPHYGLLVWSPIVLVALVGLFWLWKKDRLLAGVLGLAFLAQLYVVGSYLTWMGPGSFGARRFINCTVLFILGLAALIQWAREKKVPAVLLCGVGLLFIGWNAGLMAYWILGNEKTRQAGVPWGQLTRWFFVDLPRQGFDFAWKVLFNRKSLYNN